MLKMPHQEQGNLPRHHSSKLVGAIACSRNFRYAPGVVPQPDRGRRTFASNTGNVCRLATAVLATGLAFILASVAPLAAQGAGVSPATGGTPLEPVTTEEGTGIIPDSANRDPGSLPSDGSRASGSRSSDDESSATGVPAADHSNASRFGFSGVLRIFVEDTNRPLDVTGAGAYRDWQLGYRWSRLDDAPGRRVLGDPVGDDLDGSETEADPASIVTPAEAGLWLLESGGGTAVTVITRTPARLTGDGRLNGYHIGFYPTTGRTGAYAPPTAFIEVTPEMVDLPVSENFTVGQFLTKDQVDVWPKYLQLDLRLIDKLELVLQELNAMGIRAERMHVMSGFRTPQYNGPGGDGRAALSRHMWGDAADVWVDNEGLGNMSDLNGDGRIDHDDARVILRAVERVEARYPQLVGGAGLYPTTDTHPPYIHIDARGELARW